MHKACPAAVVRALLLALVVLSGSADATQVLRLSLPELVQRSQWIVEGRCLSTRSLRDERGLVVTEVTLLVDWGHKGVDHGERVVITLPGGELAGRRTVMVGLPEFAAGDELLLFLTAPGERDLRLPVGLAQGVFRVRRDPRNGARSLERDLTGLELVDQRTGQAVPSEPRASLAHRTLCEQIRTLVAAER